ncbi:hypothetical protein FB566_5070 [Stackebrandtia endophytica]|uniref:Abortive infection protein n=1 Tax=Stackebrandtia endophytica TaxID=1496996 RepID=A0A543B3T0_9ACTN|nr:hypothetical protein [Stackebrandtia endophytica]TQL79462.1 hypothetical protein FB566_5070 [Stackebrandtia endophytica]
MRAHGITYDTGFLRNNATSREHFDPTVVRREMTVIRDDLHCDAVHITGGDPDRLEQAARVAAELGLEVWFSPYPLELTTEEMLRLFAESARLAERLRLAGADVVFVTGVELSLMNKDLTPGTDVNDRLTRLLADTDSRTQKIEAASARLNEFLRQAVAVVREHFSGPVTYAAIPFERVDWDLFDIVSVELIRSAEVADRFREGVRSIVSQPKPVAITGFGTATWRGAPDVAPRSMEIIETDDQGTPRRLARVVERDEIGQAEYLRELLEIFDDEGVDATFVFILALYDLPHRPDGDPRDDLDLASLGVVKVLEGRNGHTYPDLPWEPKAAFTTVADYHRAHRRFPANEPESPQR